MSSKIYLSIIILLFLLSSAASFSQSNYTIVLSFDAFRWDYPQRGITPNLDFIAKNGVHAISLQSCFPSKTFPNHYSIITGMYPENHGLIANGFTNPATGESYTLYDTIPRNDPKWYKGEAIWETAKRQGVKTASYFWPGATLSIDYRRPDYTETYVHTRPYTQRISDILKWMELPYNKRPKFINVYFDSTDATGHDYGPISDEVNYAIAKQDSLIAKLFEGLRKLNLFDSTNVIVLSDHGMTELSPERVININEVLKGFNFKTQDKGTMMFVYPEKNEEDDVYIKLKKSEKNYKVYWKKDLPDHLHYKNNHFVADIVIIADLGYSIFDGKDVEKYSKHFPMGNHGYDPYNIDMHGIFYAIGPDFKSGYTCGTLQNIDIYPLLAKLLGIYPNNNIDGKLERIEFLLKDK